MLAHVGSQTFVRSIDGGGSYLSSSDPRVHFGLGDAKIDRLEIHWPSGKVEVKSDLPVNQRSVRRGSFLVRPARVNAHLDGPTRLYCLSPLPTNGILVAITVMNSTFASRGKLAMYTTARAT